MNPGISSNFFFAGPQTLTKRDWMQHKLQIAVQENHQDQPNWIRKQLSYSKQPWSHGASWHLDVLQILRPGLSWSSRYPTTVITASVHFLRASCQAFAANLVKSRQHTSRPTCHCANDSHMTPSFFPLSCRLQLHEIGWNTFVWSWNKWRITKTYKAHLESGFRSEKSLVSRCTFRRTRSSSKEWKVMMAMRPLKLDKHQCEWERSAKVLYITSGYIMASLCLIPVQSIICISFLMMDSYRKGHSEVNQKTRSPCLTINLWSKSI